MNAKGFLTLLGACAVIFGATLLGPPFLAIAVGFLLIVAASHVE